MLCITADHGNAEQMLDLETGNPHTAHTCNPVPFIVTGDKGTLEVDEKDGSLADVAPTILDIMGLPIPKGESCTISCCAALLTRRRNDWQVAC